MAGANSFTQVEKEISLRNLKLGNRLRRMRKRPDKFEATRPLSILSYSVDQDLVKTCQVRESIPISRGICLRG